MRLALVGIHTCVSPNLPEMVTKRLCVGRPVDKRKGAKTQRFAFDQP